MPEKIYFWLQKKANIPLQIDLAFKNSNLKILCNEDQKQSGKSSKMVNKKHLILLSKSKKVRVLFSSLQSYFVI